MTSNRADIINPYRISTQAISTGDYEFSNVSPLVIRNDDVVKVRFYSSQPNETDWIGVYLSDANISATSPMKFGLCDQRYESDVSEYLSTGSSELHFNLTNVRSDVTFHYFKNGFKQPILVSTSSSVQFQDYNEPLRNRIVATGDPNILKVVWNSAFSSTPVLKWGLSPNNYTYSVNASTTHISKSSLCEGGVATSIGWHDLGLQHAATLSGLAENNLGSRRIYYMFGDQATDNFSPERVFLTPPLPGAQPGSFDDSNYDTSPLPTLQEQESSTTVHTHFSALQAGANSKKADIPRIPARRRVSSGVGVPSIPSRGTQVVLMADLGVGATDSSADTAVFSEACLPALNTTLSVGHRVMQGEVDAVVLSGDLSYANGYLANWDFFLDSLAPISGGALFLTTVGNHESIWQGSTSLYQGRDSGGECGLSAELLPMPAPATKEKPWWSYDVGLLHLVGMSTEHDYSALSEQRAWLEADLERVNRTLTPWIIFTGHRPAYVDSKFCCGWGLLEDSCNGQCADYSDVTVMRQLQTHIDPLLLKYRVNLAFAGHFHNVQRQSAVYQGKVVQHSVPILDTQGNVIHLQRNPQATVHMVIGSAGNGPSFSNHRYNWSEASWDQLFGYAVVTAVNASYLQWQFIDSATEQIVDTLVITQDFEPWPLPTEVGNSDDATDQNDYSYQAQVVVIVIGTVIVLLSLLGAYWQHRRTKAVLAGISGAGQVQGFQVLDQSEHLNALHGHIELQNVCVEHDDDNVV